MRELAQMRFSIGALLVGAVFMLIGMVENISIGGISLAASDPVLRAVMAVLGLALVVSGVGLARLELAQENRGEHKKCLDHYVLFWRRGEHDWAKEDWEAAGPFVAKFGYAAGFSRSDAKNAKKVTIVGAKTGVNARAEEDLQKSGCAVRRLDGQWAEDTAALLNELTQKGDDEFEAGSRYRSPRN